VLALAAPELCGLASDVAQSGEDRTGGSKQPVFASGSGELGQPRSQDESSLHVAGNQAVVLQGNCEPVCGWSRQAGSGDQTGQGCRA
jgi:hypothetical protein